MKQHTPNLEADVYALIKESLDAIFAYSLKRTNNRHEAEDLSQDIVLNLYKSAPNLKDINKFYGWMWAVAENVFMTYLRKKQKHTSSEFQENLFSPNDELPETKVIDKEQVGVLYRELSILSGLFRETMLLYYLKGKSCEEIAQQLNISQDMVKQYLFKSRKKVREGMSIIRERGERSFNPKKFNVYFWGQGRNQAHLFTRKLPGNILLESYYEPVSLEQLSVELGVATVYLEDEVKILLKNDLIRMKKNNKFQSNIIIFTSEFETELHGKIANVYTESAEFLRDFLQKKEPAIRQLNFLGNGMEQNTLMWQMATLSIIEAVIYRFLNLIIKEFPALGGQEGYLWGMERLYGDNHFDPGIHRHEDSQGNMVRMVNYGIFNKEHYKLCEEKTAAVLFKVARGQTHDLHPYEEEILSQLVQDGYVYHDSGLRLNMPAFTREQYAALKGILEPAIEQLAANCKSITPVTSNTLANYVPGHLKHLVPVHANLKQVEGFIVNIMNEMYNRKYIHLPPNNSTEMLSTFLVLG